MNAELKIVTICAWCGNIIKGKLTGTYKVSHGMCHDCLEKERHKDNKELLYKGVSSDTTTQDTKNHVKCS